MKLKKIVGVLLTTAMLAGTMQKCQMQSKRKAL